METKIVKRDAELEKRFGRHPIRDGITAKIKALPFDAALEVEFPSKDEAVRKMATVRMQIYQQTSRLDFKLHGRLLQSDGKYIIYLWKEKKR